MVPGGLEGLIRDTSEPAPTRTVPAPPEQEPTPEQIEGLKAVIEKHAYELLI